jgi:2-iminobutanoate/2-iminopropanoate deaminase
VYDGDVIKACGLARLSQPCSEKSRGAIRDIIMKPIFIAGLTLATQLLSTTGSAQQLEYLGRPVRNIPVSSAVKVGKMVFVSGTPGYKDGKLAVGDFAAQMKQSMDNIADQLKSAGAGWDRVVRTTVMLVRRDDFGEMNRIYGGYFAEGKYPARTTTIVAGLPSPDFLVEVECEAVLE